jgi:hypothetical protein
VLFGHRHRLSLLEKGLINLGFLVITLLIDHAVVFLGWDAAFYTVTAFGDGEIRGVVRGMNCL